MFRVGVCFWGCLFGDSRFCMYLLFCKAVVYKFSYQIYIWHISLRHTWNLPILYMTVNQVYQIYLYSSFIFILIRGFHFLCTSLLFAFLFMWIYLREFFHLMHSIFNMLIFVIFSLYSLVFLFIILDIYKKVIRILAHLHCLHFRLILVFIVFIRNLFMGSIMVYKLVYSTKKVSKINFMRLSFQYHFIILLFDTF